MSKMKSNLLPAAFCALAIAFSLATEFTAYADTSCASWQNDGYTCQKWNSDGSCAAWQDDGYTCQKWDSNPPWIPKN